MKVGKKCYYGLKQFVGRGVSKNAEFYADSNSFMPTLKMRLKKVKAKKLRMRILSIYIFAHFFVI